MTINRAFREYATRVSFNLTLSRNQSYALWSIVNRKVGKKYQHQQFGCVYDNFVVGARWLESHGLVEYRDPINMEPKWSHDPWRLTEAGEHVYALLCIAGVVPKVETEELEKAS